MAGAAGKAELLAMQQATEAACAVQLNMTQSSVQQLQLSCSAFCLACVTAFAAAVATSVARLSAATFAKQNAEQESLSTLSLWSAC